MASGIQGAFRQTRSLPAWIDVDDEETDEAGSSSTTTPIVNGTTVKREKQTPKPKPKPKPKRTAPPPNDVDEDSAEAAPSTKNQKLTALSESDEESTPAAAELPISENTVTPSSSQDAVLPSSVGNTVTPSSSENTVTPSSSTAKPTRESCPYGSQCYRKNPTHKQQMAHPGDSDYVDPSAVSDEERDDDDRPECEYGIDCYRKNPQHKRDFKHTRKPQPQRATKKKRAATADSDRDSNDSYESSFIDDESDEYRPESDDETEDELDLLLVKKEPES